jgi:hypothetical protein
VVYFQTKIKICRAIENVGIFFVHLVCFKVISCNLWIFGIFFPTLACRSKENLAILSTLLKALFFWHTITLHIIGFLVHGLGSL